MKIVMNIWYVTAWKYCLLLHSFDSVQNNAKDWKSNCTKNLHALQIVASVNVLGHTTQTVINKWEKLEHIGEAIFDILFMIQSHDESMKKILEAL